MSQSLARLYVHLVFGTKDRIHLIKQEISNELYSYIGGTLNNLGCRPVKIGGDEDHIHILCCLSKEITIIKLVKEIKQSSSIWIKTKSYEYRNFYWQDGYGAFSVCPRHVENLISYINNQKEHHHKKSFRQEFTEILDENGIDYDQLYLWD